MNESLLTEKQIRWLLFASLISDALVAPFGATDAFSAWETIWGILLAAALTLWVSAFFCRCIAPVKACADHEEGLQTISQKIQRKWPQILLAIAFLFCAACAFLQAERFYRFCSAEPLPSAVTLILLLCVSFYAVACGAKTISRVAGLVLWMAAFSAVLLIAANAGSAQIVNLQQVQQGGAHILRASVTQLRFPAEILLYCILPRKQEARQSAHKSIKGVATIFGGYVILKLLAVFGAELVMGTGAQYQTQGLYALSQIGGVSVFKRLDAVYLGVWMLLLLLKGTVLLLGAWRFLPCTGIFTQQAKRFWLLGGGVLAGLIVAAVLPPYQWVYAVGTITAAAAGLLFLRRKSR